MDVNDVMHWISWPVDGNDVMHWKCVRRIWGILKRSVSWVLLSEEERWLSLARRDFGQVSHEMGWGADEKARIERMCISLLMSKLKGNKKFCTWTKKSLVFFVFRDSYVLCICMFHLSVSAYGTIVPLVFFYKDGFSIK